MMKPPLGLKLNRFCGGSLRNEATLEIFNLRDLSCRGIRRICSLAFAHANK